MPEICDYLVVEGQWQLVDIGLVQVLGISEEMGLNCTD